MEEVSVAACRDMVRRSFASESEIAKYRERVAAGLLNWEAVLVRAYFAARPGPLLDVGCGAGREAFALQELGYDVTAVDISEELLDAAKSRAKELKRPITFMHCDGQHFDFDDATFAYVFVPSQVLGNIPGAAFRLAFLSEIRRVLRTNGVVIFCGHNRAVCEREAHREGVVQYSADMESGDLIWTESGTDTPCYWHYFNAEEMYALCERAGFETLTCCLASDVVDGGWDSILVCAGRKTE